MADSGESPPPNPRVLTRQDIQAWLVEQNAPAPRPGDIDDGRLVRACRRMIAAKAVAVAGLVRVFGGGALGADVAVEFGLLIFFCAAFSAAAASGDPPSMVRGAGEGRLEHDSPGEAVATAWAGRRRVEADGAGLRLGLVLTRRIDRWQLTEIQRRGGTYRVTWTGGTFTLNRANAHERHVAEMIRRFLRARDRGVVFADDPRLASAVLDAALSLSRLEEGEQVDERSISLTREDVEP